MRIRFLFLCVSAGLVAGGFAVQACGGTQSDSTPVDAGQDVVDASVKDTNAPDVKDSAPPCDPTADFLKDIPDASLADGATTSGICLACAKTKCKNELAACSKDCACQSLAGDAIDCYLKSTSKATSDLIKCVSGFAGVSTSTRNIGLGVFGCINNECPDECATAAFNPDAGADADAN
jgi:hypothetical protein